MSKSNQQRPTRHKTKPVAYSDEKITYILKKSVVSVPTVTVTFDAGDGYSSWQEDGISTSHQALTHIYQGHDNFENKFPETANAAADAPMEKFDWTSVKPASCSIDESQKNTVPMIRKRMQYRCGTYCTNRFQMAIAS